MRSLRSSETDRATQVERIAGRYRVETRLAQGGMGSVYRVLDESSGQRLALKRLLASSKQEQNALLFAREYHTLRSLKHPRVIEVYDFGVDAVGPYYTMELLEGRDLRELAPLDYRTACRHLRDIASSLALLHARRLLHRDISARNVRVASDGRCKLIDFGALTNFGVSNDLVGTPPNIPPEAVRGESLDQRADLYALGTLAYALLTGRQAYPARRLEDLIDVWKIAPPGVSTLVHDIPAALEQLVFALISHDPLARPVSAADVIERLNTIADLEPEDESAVAEGYLVSPQFVGRKTELELLKRSVSQSFEGRGRAVLVEGPLGLGKSRLLGELALHAQTLGAVVLQVDAEMHQRSFGVLEALALRALELMPEQALALSWPHASVLAHLSPILRERLKATADASVLELPGEWRGRAQAAMQDWLLSLAVHRPLLIAIDNFQAADPASAAVLSSLARASKRKRVLVACTLRTGERVSAPDAMRLLREHSTRVQLSPLDAQDVAALVRSLFGDVLNAARVGKWIFESAGGNALHSVELARHLVSTGGARYVDGSWALTGELGAVAPGDLGGLTRARLAHLSADARDFASVLSVQQGPLPLELCVKLWAEPNHERVFRTFDELVREGILRTEGENYGFSQQSLREQLVGELEPERRRKLHRQIAELLLANAPDDARVSIEAGWHLLRAGDETRGAELLARVGGRTHAVGTINNDFHAAVPALEAALDVYRKQGRSSYELVPLLTSLCRAGYYVDRRLATDYGEEALTLLPKLTGLTLANRLRPWLGAHLSLTIGVLVAYARFKLSRADGYRFRELFVFFFSCITTLCGVAVICLDITRAASYARMVEPLLVLGKDKAPAGIHEYCRLLTQIGADRFADTRGGLIRLREAFADERLYRSLPGETRKLYQGGIEFALGVVEAFSDGPGALQCADRLERLELKMYEMVANHVRALHHAARGELDRARECRERLDVHAVQAGSAWQVEIWAPAGMILPYLAAQDVSGLKRTRDQLNRLAREIPSLERYARLANAAYLASRNDWERALPEYQRAIEEEAPRALVGWTAAIGGMAGLLNAKGDYQRAREICRRTCSHLTDADRPFAMMTLRVQIEWAMADAGLGDTAAAAARLDALIDAHKAGQGPLTLGNLHAARARVAILEKDPVAFAEHADQMSRWFRPTRNPTLIAQCAKLEKLALQTGLDRSWTSASEFELNSFENITRSLIVGSHSPEERAARALELLVREARAHRGFLFERTEGGLRLVARVSDEPPPEQIEQALLAKVMTASGGLSVREGVPTRERQESEPGSGGAETTRQLGLVLSTHADGKLLIYGAVAMEGPNLLAPTHPFLQSITRGMLGLDHLSQADPAGQLCTTAAAPE